MKLNEYVIKAKTKVTNIASIKDLNCWGTDLTDISILADLPNLEVLSLSVNLIESLEPLQHCLKLKKLYVRKNLISDVKQISYLSGLLALRCLNMSENPICDLLGAEYRITVLRHLPNLEILDEIDVTPEELHVATVPESAHSTEETESSDLDTIIPIFNVPPLDFKDSELTFSSDAETDVQTLSSVESSQSTSLSMRSSVVIDKRVRNQIYDGATLSQMKKRRVHNETTEPEDADAPQRDMLIASLCIAKLLDRNDLLVLQAMIKIQFLCSK